MISARLIIATVVTSLFISINLYGQATGRAAVPDTADYPFWVEMMQDPDANFYDVQRAFNTYWDGREVTKGSGFKPFKRWEYMMQESRINPDGTRIPASHKRNEYFSYLENQSGNRSAAGNWISLGPSEIPVDRGYKGLGRLNAIAFHPTDPDIIFVGAPAGGLWKTTTGGNAWESLTDDQPTLGVSAIIIDYNDPDLIFMGTGDRDAGDAEGLGVMKSIDGGQTWVMWNSGMGDRTVGRMIQHPTNNQLILAATNGGIYKTVDGGISWYQVISGNFKEIVFKPGDPSVIYASSNGNFYKSTDTGQGFYLITNGLPGGNRGVIGVTPAAPDYVYFLITQSSSFKGLYRSMDGGQTFTEKSTTPNIMSWGCNGGSGGQAWYDLDIAVDPSNADMVFAGGVNCFKSFNGGQTWSISSHWWGDCDVPAVHADLHVLEYNPLNWTLYVGNDGGIYYTDNQGSGWNLITNGLVISQVYKIGQSATERDKCLNGYQDNGTSTYMGEYWEFTRGGDGMECAVDHENALYSYATVYYGNIDRYYNNNWSANIASDGNHGLTEDGAWITPFILDEANPEIMFIGYKNVWRCLDVKASSNQISWQQISSGLGNSNSQNMRVIEQSPPDVNILYAARYDDKLFRTDNAHDGAPGWTDLTPLLPENTGIVDLECHPDDPETVYMSHDNKIWKSTDRGLAWEDISGTLPDVSYTSIAYYKNSHDGLYVSSDIGVFFKDKFMADWVMFSDGLPVDASIREIEIFYDPDSVQNDIIRAGTYGRGMWESDMYHYDLLCDISASETVITPQCAIDFTDNSCGVPTRWEWTFEGGTPGTSWERNPKGIVYDEAGTYDVKLVAYNENGVDSIVKTEYIHVSSELMPGPGFTISETNPCIQEWIYINDTSSFCPTGWLWEFLPGPVYFRDGTGPDSRHPVIEFRHPGVYSVTQTVTNANGSSSITLEDYIFVGGYALPFFEDFESGSLDHQGWTVINQDHSNTWEDYEIEATGNHTARMKLYAYYGMGERDQLITPNLSFAGMDEVYLNFRYAYSQRFNQKDSLIVYVSGNCGSTWNRVYAGGPDGTGIFATTMPVGSEFIPDEDNQWCGTGYGADCISIDLSAWSGNSDIRIMFESYNNLGNNLYIDDILISNTTGMVDLSAGQAGRISIYPNPNAGTFIISGSGIKEAIDILVVNIHGQEVWQGRCPCESGTLSQTIDISSFPGGVYFVKVADSNNIQVKKIIVH